MGKYSFRYLNIDVLVVDDEEIITSVVKSFIEPFCRNVYTAFNGKEAIKVLENNYISFVLTDLIMPKINGSELVEYIMKNNTEVIPIIIISAIGREVEKFEYLDNVKVLQKPFNGDELYELMEEMTNRRNLYDLESCTTHLEEAVSEAKILLDKISKI